MINPCPCASLQKGCKIIAILDCIFAGNDAAICILGLFGIHYQVVDKLSEEIPVGSGALFLTQLIVYFLACVWEIGLFVFLMLSVGLRYYRGCRIWLIGTYILYFVYLSYYMALLAAGQDPVPVVVVLCVAYTYTVYAICVVKSFMNELIADGRADNTTASNAV